MSETVRERRVRSVPATGTRLCLVGAALCLVAAGYFLLAPVQVAAGNGKTFDCGTVLDGPRTEFARGVCGSGNDLNAARATASGVAALVLAVGGFLVFGVDRREDVSGDAQASEDPA